jgi:hypothetical protein
MKQLCLIVALTILFFAGYAQDLLKEAEDSLAVKEYVSGAFKSTRVINAHSVEMLAKHNLDFRIMHRFGFVSDGIKQFFGLDQASMRMSFDYGITNNLTAGIGRSTFRKELDFFLKKRFIQQSTGPHSSLFSIVAIAGTTIWTEQSFEPKQPSTADRTAYYIQLLIGRKFSPRFSFQLSPVLVHTNLPLSITTDQKIFALGGGGRYKFSKRMALTFDYHHPLGTMEDVYTNPLSLGVDIETGGHVFQLQFSNATGMNERAYITQTTGKFFKGNIRFGFNLSRIFKTGKHKAG